MRSEATVRLGPLMRLAAYLTGADPEILRRCPPRDHSSVSTIALLLLGIWLWQTIAFSLTAHMLLDEMGHIRSELVAISALMAGMIMLIDSYSLIRASWYLKGLEELKRAGLEIPGYLGLRVRNGLQLILRVAVAVVMSLAAAVGFNLFCTSPEIDRLLAVTATEENAGLLERTAKAYDAETARDAVDIEALRRSLAKTRGDAGALRLDVLRASPDEPELRAALGAERRAETVCTAAERRLSQSATNTPARQAAQQQVSRCRAERQAAQAKVAQLRTRGQDATARHRAAVQGRLGETAATEQNLQTRLDAREATQAARVAGREDNIRAAVRRDPSYRPAERGLLARVKALVQLMSDPWVLGMTVLLHLAFLGVELGAVLCKVLTFVPSSYAVILASEEHAHAAATASELWTRIGGEAPPDAGGLGEPAPLPMAEEAIWTAAPANDDAAVETAAVPAGTAGRFEESAELARAQAAARAADKAKRARAMAPSPPAEPGTLAASVLDGAERRGRGRPPGARNRPKPANDAEAATDGVDAA